MQFLYKLNKTEIFVSLLGDFTFFDNSKEKDSFFKILDDKDIKKIEIDFSQLGLWGSSLSAFIYKIAKISERKKITLSYKNIPTDLKSLLILALTVDRKPNTQSDERISFLEDIGIKSIFVFFTVKKGIKFLREIFSSLFRFIKGRSVMRFVDFVSALNECGPRAVLIVSLISFMVGLILAFVGSIQLKTFGAQIYVASLVTIGMIRIMGAIMVGIIMAGRTGASYAASIGTMQVNEELDALKTMGISSMDFLVLPRLLSLIISMPILVMLADFMGMFGGAFVGTFLLGISPEEYWKYAMNAFGLGNFLVGIFHGVVFGLVISVCGCYYGINCGRNADSVGSATTRAVVSSIVWMIVLTGFITWLFAVLGV